MFPVLTSGTRHGGSHGEPTCHMFSQMCCLKPLSTTSTYCSITLPQPTSRFSEVIYDPFTSEIYYAIVITIRFKNGLCTYFYRLRSVVSEGYVFMGICLSNLRGVGMVTSNASWDRSHGLIGGRCLVWWGGGHHPNPPPRQTWSPPPPEVTPRQRTREYGQWAGGTHLTGIHPFLLQF